MNPRHVRLITAYAGFAFVAILANLGSQRLFLAVYRGTGAIIASMLAGTAVGLMVKYVLDKKYIFRFQSRDAKHELRTATMYTVMGLATTAIFWGTELSFAAIFRNDPMRYLGGFIGLCLGYYAKYRLDKHFVFKP